MAEIRLNHVINGTEVATIDGNYAQDINLFPSIQSNITTLTDSNYYKLGNVPYGVAGTDAVNISQLNSLANSMTSSMSTMQSAINSQASSMSTISSQISTLMAANQAGDYKHSARATDHSGWLLCDGRAISRSSNPGLFTAIGTAFGIGDGSTTFNIPNAKGRSAVFSGQGNTAEGGGAGTNRVLGSSGGTETHVMTVGELPPHTHNYTANTVVSDASLSLLGSGNRVTAQPTVATSSVGSGTAMSLMHPWISIGNLFIYAS